MFERKVQFGGAVSRTDRRKIKQAYHGSRSTRSSGARIVMLMALAVAGVVGLSQALLAIAAM